MRILSALIFALTIALAWQSVALADSHGKATEAATETAKDAGETETTAKDEKKKNDEEDPDCE